jgi:phosphate transport system substrate-binding protein
MTRFPRRAVILGIAVAVLLPAGMAGADGSHALIQGSGSSWSSNALNQWVADVQPNGIQVVYTASGSAQGRKDFAFRTTDFAVTEIGYQGVDELTGDSDTSQGRAYSYLPIVAGGTAFPYQIRVHGDLVRDLRLSGATVAKIFTNQITDWSDPAITADNNGRVLPSLPIIPVVHSEGSGTSAHFTDYLDKQFPDLWRAFNGGSGLTEYYPRVGSAIAQSGSEGLMNFITSSAANGSIGYVEYSYPLGKDYPVAKIENAAGYFTLPTQYNVAVALTQAIINSDVNSPDYLLQDLTNVYTYNDPRTYVMSSYSYMVIPTASDDSKMTTAKRQSIADFLYYSICEGQREVGPIGYSPLPVNLVQAGFAQTARLHTADANVDLTQRDVSTCHNPTFDPTDLSRNRLAEIAPPPLPCDQRGQTLCTGNEPAPKPLAEPTTATTTPPPVVATPTATTSPPGASQTATAAGGSATTTTVANVVSTTIDPGQTGNTEVTIGVFDDGDGASAGAASAEDGSPTDGAPLALGDLPLSVAPASSNGLLWPIVVVLVAVLLAVPAFKLRLPHRRRRVDELVDE